jgi:hypothetical protein
MSCKECIHYNACKFTYIEAFGSFNEEQFGQTGCAEFEDKSRYIELPCAVGDDIYWVYYKRAEIKRYIVRSINIIVLDNHITTTIQFHEPNGYREFHYQFSPDCFGKTVFLTKEEAEKALAERKHNNG